MGYPFFPYTVKAAQEAGIEDVSEINRNCGFATRLRGLRTGAELSQAALAKALGIVKSTLGLYETGDTVPDARTLCAIARYFGVSADYLLGLPPVDKRDKGTQFALRNLTQSIVYIHECANIALNSLDKYLKNELNLLVSETISKEE